MPREISLSGSEITVLKSIGLGGTQVYGNNVLEKVEDVERGEFLETLTDLIDRGYVLSNKVNIRTIEDMEKAFFRVSPTYARDLRDAINPSRTRERDRGRRQRRE
jgi:hypothetical protein